VRSIMLSPPLPTPDWASMKDEVAIRFQDFVFIVLDAARYASFVPRPS